LGLGDVSWLGGHRALTHSLPFAAALAVVAVAAVCRGTRWRPGFIVGWTYFALAFALHGALDALTTYGEGVMFFAPFSESRFKSAWHPIDSLLTEIVAIWLPAVYIIWYRRRNRPFGSCSPAT
jgi:membrane-bound metal-dependent hydrolase YbcI (DUF457 family)